MADATRNEQAILVVGSVAIDDVQTPAGHREISLGGSANYFAVGASLFVRTKLVAVVGDDFPSDHLELLAARDVDLAGLEIIEGGRTFRWRGSYGADFADAQTLETQLNVFEHFQPKVPESYRSAPYVFLGNIHPALQLQVLEQIERPKLVGLDTMNFWISSAREALGAVLKRIDLLIVNETEARQISGENNVYDAADSIMKDGPKMLVIKRGAAGALLFHPEGMFCAPAVPLREVIDPTGAGDSFAAGLMGYIAKAGSLDFKTFKQAVLAGTVVASYACEGFSMDKVLHLTASALEERTAVLRALISLD